MVAELGLNALISAGAVVFAAFFVLPSLASSVMRDDLFRVLVNLGQSVSGYASARARSCSPCRRSLCCLTYESFLYKCACYLSLCLYI